MALPGDVTTFTLTFGPYYDAAGEPAFAGMTGKIKPSRSPILHTDGSVLVDESVPVTIDAFGEASVELVHNDHGGGFTYSVVWDVASRKPSPKNKPAISVTSEKSVADFDELVASEQVPGVVVPRGPQGDSAYDVAVANGFIGTESAWLASLEGPQGLPGVADDSSVAALIPGPGATADALRAAFGLGATATDAAVEAFVGTEGTKTRASLLRDFVGTGSVSLPSGARIVPLPGILKNEWRYNATTFIQDNVTTVGGVQYAVWVNDAGNPVIGKHIPGSDDWHTFDLSTIPGNPLSSPVNGDGHNVYVVAVDSDGYLHISGDSHSVALHYVRSTAPHSITAWEAPGMIGTNEAEVSYPQFVHLPDDELLFAYRDGGEGDGARTVINAYDTASRSWSRRSIPLDGASAEPFAGSYINRIAVADDGRLHMFYLWRDAVTDFNGPTIGYLTSGDGGATWAGIDGAAVTLPVTPSTHVPIASISPLNQQGAAVDAAGYPHSAWVCTKGIGVVIRHVYWDGSAWITEDVIDPSNVKGTVTRNPRAALFAHGPDTFLIYSTGQTGPTGGGARSLRVRNLSAADRHVDFALIEANLGHFEPSLDQLALRDNGELVMLVTQVQAEAASAANVDLPKHMRSGGGILTYPLSALRLSAALDDGPARNQRVWLTARDLVGDEGAPILSAQDGVPVWQLPDGATTSISTVAHIPDRWQAYNVDVWWARNAAAAGSISLVTMLGQMTPGDALTAIPSGASTTFTVTAAAAAGELQTTVTRTVNARPNPSYDTDRLTRLRIRRAGVVAEDTLPGNALVLGVVLSPALLP